MVRKILMPRARATSHIPRARRITLLRLTTADYAPDFEVNIYKDSDQHEPQNVMREELGA